MLRPQLLISILCSTFMNVKIRFDSNLSWAVKKWLSVWPKEGTGRARRRRRRYMLWTAFLLTAASRVWQELLLTRQCLLSVSVWQICQRLCLCDRLASVCVCVTDLPVSVSVSVWQTCQCLCLCDRLQCTDALVKPLLWSVHQMRFYKSRPNATWGKGDMDVGEFWVCTGSPTTKGRYWAARAAKDYFWGWRVSEFIIFLCWSYFCLHGHIPQPR